MTEFGIGIVCVSEMIGDALGRECVDLGTHIERSIRLIEDRQIERATGRVRRRAFRILAWLCPDREHLCMNTSAIRFVECGGIEPLGVCELVEREIDHEALHCDWSIAVDDVEPMTGFLRVEICLGEVESLDDAAAKKKGREVAVWRADR